MNLGAPCYNWSSYPPDGNDIERDELVYSINELDTCAVEEALQITGKHSKAAFSTNFSFFFLGRSHESNGMAM